MRAATEPPPLLFLGREEVLDLLPMEEAIEAMAAAFAALAARRALRPIARVRVWSRTPERARRFAAAMTETHGLPVEAAATAEAAVAGAGIVCTLTAAREPVLQGDWLAPGAHLNAVGSCSP